MRPDRALRPERLWRAFLRLVIAALSVVLLLAVFLSLFPGALVPLLELLPGHVAIPELGDVPPEPRLDAALAHPLPGGYTAFTGVVAGMPTACNFLLELEDGQRVGVGTAHAVPYLPADSSVVFRAADGEIAARMGRRIAIGQEFRGQQLNLDYALWLVEDVAGGIVPLRPDPRGQAQPGERIMVFGRADDGAGYGAGGSQRRAGVVMAADLDVTWLKMEDAFDPRGYSGCPVVSTHTGQVIGMAVAGSRKSPVILGLHPIGSLVEKAEAALAEE